MERLTERDAQGLVYLICRDGCRGGPACFECEQRAARRLADFEDTGLEPEAAAQLKQIAEIFNCDPGDPAQLRELLDKLQGWRDAETDGRMVVLPSRQEMREHCPMRHPDNGNCTVAGGFCHMGREICKALNCAYDVGFGNGAKEALERLKGEGEHG